MSCPSTSGRHLHFDVLHNRLPILAIFTAAAFLTGCGLSQLPSDNDEVFKYSVQKSLSNNHTEAARGAYQYIQGTTPDNERYDRALRVLAENLDELGMTYAASLWYLEIAKSRRDPELIDDAVRGLEEIMARENYDRATLLSGYVASAEISGLPPEQAAFVSYHQGMDNLRRELDDWAVRDFRSIPEDSPYRDRADFALMMTGVADYELESTVEALETLLEREELPEDLKVDVHRTLARIAFEQERFDDALEAYEEIRDTAPEDPKLLLEMAWTHYYIGDYQRSLGLLVALDAPAFSGLIAPERYLLEALALKQLCQFEPARNAAVRLRRRHGDAIEDLYDGTPLKLSDAIRQAARQRTRGDGIAEFRLQVQSEARLVDEHRKKLGEDLAGRLDQVYKQGLRESRRREDAELYDEMETVSEELLAAEEGVRLVLHELAVSLLRGRRRGEQAPSVENVEVPAGGERVFFRFEGEFWTDEIDDLVVPMEDRCIE